MIQIKLAVGTIYSLMSGILLGRTIMTGMNVLDILASIVLGAIGWFGFTCYFKEEK